MPQRERRDGRLRNGLFRPALLDWVQVKKTRRASLTKRKGQCKPGSARPSQGAGGGGIPVRGARKSQVKSRAALGAEPRPARSEAELADTRALAIAAMEAALDKQALEPVLIDVSAIRSYTAFIGIVSGRSDRQVDAIADNISQVMKSRGVHALGQEGSGSGRWT